MVSEPADEPVATTCGLCGYNRCGDAQQRAESGWTDGKLERRHWIKIARQTGVIHDDSRASDRPVTWRNSYSLRTRCAAARDHRRFTRGAAGFQKREPGNDWSGALLLAVIPPLRIPIAIDSGLNASARLMDRAGRRHWSRPRELRAENVADGRVDIRPVLGPPPACFRTSPRQTKRFNSRHRPAAAPEDGNRASPPDQSARVRSGRIVTPILTLIADATSRVAFDVAAPAPPRRTPRGRAD
jgi:hypothetical protein